MADPAGTTSVATTFCVDVDRLGEIPAVVDAARAQLAATAVSASGADASRAAPAAMVDRLVAALDRFLAAGMAALDADAAKLRAARDNYARCELGAIGATRRLSDRITTVGRQP